MTGNTIAAGLSELMALSPPEESALSTASEADLWSALKRFRSFVFELGRSDLDLRISDERLSSSEFACLVRKTVGTFDYIAHRLLALNGRASKDRMSFTVFQLLKINERSSDLIKRMTDDPDSEQFHINALLVRTLLLIQGYGLYLASAEELAEPRADITMSPSFSRLLDYSLINGLSSIAELLSGSDDEELTSLISQMLKSGLAQASRIASCRQEETNAAHEPGRFSLIRPGDLAPIAERSETMIKRYGDKALESVFEQQLVLIFQSFGFLVVPTKSGRSTVDLLCLSNDASPDGQIMVEAKTTKGIYGLPRRDQRALREYVESVRKRLKILPPSKLLLIVAPRAASTLASKLKALSRELSLPVRFMSASLLAEIRETTPGPVPSELFVESLLAEDLIVGECFPGQLAQRLDGLENAHRRFADELESVWSIWEPARGA